MNQHYRRHGILFISLFLLTVLSQWAQAKLVIEPARPIIAMGQQIQLRVLGEKGEVTWQSKGIPLGKGDQITYVAPNEVGQYYVSASTDKESAKAIITVLTAEKAAQAFAPEKGVNKVFANRSTAFTMLLSDDGKILWIGTSGGLEQREVTTGKLINLFTTTNGLPSNNAVRALASDGNGGLWVGNGAGFSGLNGGLAYRSPNGEWKTFEMNLSFNDVSALANDGNGGVWVGTGWDGLSHLKSTGEWTDINVLNSSWADDINAITYDKNGGLWAGSSAGLFHLNDENKWEHLPIDSVPHAAVHAIISDGEGGVWVGAGYYLIHIDHRGEWTIFNGDDNFKFPGQSITGLASDGKGGLWIGTAEGGLVHFDGEYQWQIFTMDNSPLPNHYMNAVSSDGSGGVWMSIPVPYGKFADNRYGRLVHLSELGEWTVLEVEPDLPSNIVSDIVGDNRNGIWVSTIDGGIVHISADEKWTFFNPENSNLPSYTANALANDGNDGIWVWVGDDNVLVHYQIDSSQGGIFKTDNSEVLNKLSEDPIMTNDGNTGIWMGTSKGLIHFTENNQWEIFDSENSKLPDNNISSLVNDGNDGVWIGTANGLAHLSSSKTWEIFNTNNSNLPTNQVIALASDDKSGLWIKTSRSEETNWSDSLVHLISKEQWQLFDLSTNNYGIYSIANDGSGGVWMLGSEALTNSVYGGKHHLLHFSNIDQKIRAFSSNQSSVSYTFVKGLTNDGKGGLWLAPYLSGVTHLTFSQKPFLCEKANVPDMTDEQCAALLKGSRSAILIHPNGQGNGYNQDYATEVMATHAYQTLVYGRGYDIDEIYFLSYKPDPDFNGDGIADSIVTAPVTLAEFRNKVPPRDLTLEDVTKAFDWAKANSQKAKEAGLPEQPLVVIFIDHGLPNHLLLSPTTPLDDVTLNGLLADYQTTTGNQAIVIMEACYTGTLINGLQANKRVIISSTGQDKSYYSDYGRVSFTQFYFDELYHGANYRDGVDFVKSHVLVELGRPLNQQTPRLEDLAGGEVAASFCLNGCFGSRREPKLTPQISSRQVAVGDTVKLAVAIEENGSTVIQVETSIVTPTDARERNEQGFSLNAPLIKQLTDPEKDDSWEYEFKEFTEPGQYTFFFKADYKIDIGTRTLNARQAITVCVEPCQRTTANFESATGILHLPAVAVPTGNGDIAVYQADLVLQTGVEPVTLQLDMNSVKPLDKINSVSHTQFDPSTGIVQIPVVEIPEVSTGEIKTYRAELQLVPGSSPMRFTVKLLESKPR